MQETKSLELDELEAIINDPDSHFYARGLALLETVKLKHLPAENLDPYSRERFGFTGERARQLMSAARVIAVLLTDPTAAAALPASENMTRPLTGLPENKLIDVWNFINATAPEGEPTAAYVKAVVDRVKLSPNDPIPMCHCLSLNTARPALAMVYLPSNALAKHGKSYAASSLICKENKIKGVVS